MRYRDYLRLDGGCSTALGLALAVLGAPGVLAHYGTSLVAVALAFVPIVLLGIGGFAAARHGAALNRPGEWLTQRALTAAQPGRGALAGTPVRRRLLAETAAWIAGSALWLALTGSSAFVFLGSGLASAAYGGLEAVLARRRVEARERELGIVYVVARRPGLGTPELGIASTG